VTARLASLPKAAQVALVASVLLLVALMGYFTLISPKKSTAAKLKKQTVAVQAQINNNRSTAFTQALPACAPQASSASRRRCRTSSTRPT